MAQLWFHKADEKENKNFAREFELKKFRFFAKKYFYDTTSHTKTVTKIAEMGLMKWKSHHSKEQTLFHLWRPTRRSNPTSNSSTSFSQTLFGVVFTFSKNFHFVPQYTFLHHHNSDKNGHKNWGNGFHEVKATPFERPNFTPLAKNPSSFNPHFHRLFDLIFGLCQFHTFFDPTIFRV